MASPATSSSAMTPNGAGAESGAPERSDTQLSEMQDPQASENGFGTVKRPHFDTSHPKYSKSIQQLHDKTHRATLCGTVGVLVAFAVSSIFFTLGYFSMKGKVYLFDLPNLQKMNKF